ncbi:cell division protein ZapA [Parabacteroides chinchillae]|uniref:Cell division protein ZapA n=1 Tax=Parabacteroides chinchillae TaxID=871327 RepID=A0A8G2BXG2_9BACT|nr:cell division protein ZapA [Parabacteroides chinchillae]SEG04342.1 cell division protein ZapA [Parabacteroides chinchillae]
MDDPLGIHLNIAGKSYPLTIERKDEEIYRKAEVRVREVVSLYHSRFGSDMKDLLAMAAVHLALQNLQLRDKNDTSPFTEKIQQLTAELESYLKEK